MRALVLLLVGCATLEPRRHRPEPMDVDSLVFVTIDADLPPGDCDDAIPRRYEIVVDASAVGHLDVPCARALPPGVSIDPSGVSVTASITIRPGTHQLGIRDHRTGITEVRTFTFPYYLPQVVPTGDFYEQREPASALDISLIHATEIRILAPSSYQNHVLRV